jgi:hypothetical protein
MRHYLAPAAAALLQFLGARPVRALREGHAFSAN